MLWVAPVLIVTAAILHISTPSFVQNIDEYRKIDNGRAHKRSGAIENDPSSPSFLGTIDEYRKIASGRATYKRSGAIENDPSSPSFLGTIDEYRNIDSARAHKRSSGAVGNDPSAPSFLGTIDEYRKIDSSKAHKRAGGVDGQPTDTYGADMDCEAIQAQCQCDNGGGGGSGGGGWSGGGGGNGGGGGGHGGGGGGHGGGGGGSGWVDAFNPPVVPQPQVQRRHGSYKRHGEVDEPESFGNESISDSEEQFDGDYDEAEEPPAPKKRSVPKWSDRPPLPGEIKEIGEDTGFAFRPPN